MPNPITLLGRLFSSGGAFVGSEPAAILAEYGEVIGIIGALAHGAELDDATVSTLEAIPGVRAARAGRRARSGSLYSTVGSVAIVEVQGVLGKSEADVGDFGTGFDAVLSAVRAARSDSKIGSVLLRIDSPGGAAVPTEPAADELFDMRGDGGVPVIALADDMAASAALYLATQASEFYGTQASMNGSIGTIIQTLDISKLLDEFGVKVNTIKSVESKDTGSMFRPMSDADRRHLQGLVDDFAGRFKAAVSRGRGLDAAAVHQISQKPLYLGQEGVDAGLLDGVVRNADQLVAQLNDRFPAGRSPASGARAQLPVASSSTTPPAVAALATGDTAKGHAMTQTTDQGATGASTAAQTQQAAGAAPPAATPPAGDQTAAAVTLERQRVAAIQSAADRFPSNEKVQQLAKACITDGTSIHDFREKLTDTLAESGGSLKHAPSGSIQVGPDARTKMRAAHELAIVGRLQPDLLHTLGQRDKRSDLVAEALGFTKAADATQAIREVQQSGVGRMRIDQIAARCIALNEGISLEEVHQRYGGSDGAFMAAAFHTTSDFPKILENVIHKTLAAPLQEIRPFWRDIARKGTTSDFKPKKIYKLSEGGNLQLIPEGGTPEHTTFNEQAESVQVEPYGRRVSLTYQMMRNDDLGAFTSIITWMSLASIRLPDQILITLLSGNSGNGPDMDDGVAMFNAAHGNTASAAALSYTNVRAAMKIMREMTGFGPDSALIEVTPRVLLVPNALYNTAEDITMQEFVPGSDGANNQRNMLRNQLRPVGSPRLDAVSATRWWLFADPTLTPAFEVAFLDGAENPRVDPIHLDNPLDRGWQITLPGIGATAVHYEAAYSNPGS